MSNARLASFRNGIVVVLLIVSAWRLVSFSTEAVSTGLQMDFSAMYAAGRSLNHDLDPYHNNVDTDPVVWDGIAYYKHGRFLYPPLAASFFQVFGSMDYSVAKQFWTFLNILGIILAVWFTAKSLQLKPEKWEWTLVAVIGINCYPLYVLLERGQVDGVLIGLIAAGIYFGLQGGRKVWLAGMLIALACLLKLYLIFLIPFILLLKKWRWLLSIAASGVVLLLMSIALNGMDSLKSYTNEHLPRVIEYGEKGADSDRLDRETLLKLYQNVQEPGHTEVQGEDYVKGLFEFDGMAGWVGVFRNALKSVGWKNGSLLSASLVGIGLILVLLFVLIRPEKREFNQQNSTLLLFIGCTSILFLGPLTWTMSMVWLIPIGLVLVVMRKEIPKWTLVALSIAFLLLIIPDSKALPELYPKNFHYFGKKYNLVQVLILMSMVVILVKNHSTKNA